MSGRRPSTTWSQGARQRPRLRHDKQAGGAVPRRTDRIDLTTGDVSVARLARVMQHHPMRTAIIALQEDDTVQHAWLHHHVQRLGEQAGGRGTCDAPRCDDEAQCHKVGAKRSTKQYIEIAFARAEGHGHSVFPTSVVGKRGPCCPRVAERSYSDLPSHMLPESASRGRFRSARDCIRGAGIDASVRWKPRPLGCRNHVPPRMSTDGFGGGSGHIAQCHLKSIMVVVD